MTPQDYGKWTRMTGRSRPRGVWIPGYLSRDEIVQGWKEDTRRVYTTHNNGKLDLDYVDKILRWAQDNDQYTPRW